MMEPPVSYSPSSMAQFSSCPLAFKYQYLDKIKGPPSAPASCGTLVHLALQYLLWRPPRQRTVKNAMVDLVRARIDLADEREFRDLQLSPGEWRTFHTKAAKLVANYFTIEDPKKVRPIGFELRLQAVINGVTVRGVIDRLDLTPAGLVVVDYKSGRSPSEMWEQSSLHGVNIYASMVENVFGVRPVRVELLYIAKPERITCEPTGPAARSVDQRVSATSKAVERACTVGEFRPRLSKLCEWCAYQDLCPAYVPKETDVEASGY